ELQPRVGLLLCAVDWYRILPIRDYFAAAGDHAGEMETSVMLRVAPELVLPLSEAGEGRERKPRLTAMQEGWAWTPRRWTQVTSDTGVGDPSAATAEKGDRYFTDVTARIGRFLIDLAAADPDDLYQEL